MQKTWKILGSQYYLGNYGVSPSYFRARNGSTLLVSWQLLNSFKENSSNFLLLWLTASFAFHVQREHYDEMIYPSAKYKLFTYTRQFCIKNITLSYDKFFRICHAVNTVLVHVLALSQTYPLPLLRRSLFQSLSLYFQHSPS